MANYLDPEADSEAPVAGDTQSSDQSKPGLRKAWDAFTSRPENSAALMQFGIALLQPRSPGQSAIGQVGNALAEGAGASERNVANQRAVSAAESAQALEEAKTAATTRNSESSAVNAAAYKQSVDQVGVGGGKGLTGALRLQSDFRKWLSKPEDSTGLTSDPIVGAIQRIFPEIKTKADLLAHPAAKAAAMKLYATQIADPSPDAEEGTSPTPAQPAKAGVATPPFIPRSAQDKNGKTWTESSPGVFKDAAGNTYSP